MRNVAFAVTLLATLAMVWGYPMKYEDLDVDGLLVDDHPLGRYGDYLLPDADIDYNMGVEELNNVVPDSLQKECSHCNQQQQAEADSLLLRSLINHMPDPQQLLQDDQDTEGSYTLSHDAELWKIFS